MYRKLLIALPVASFLWLLLTVLVAGYFYPGYSHVAQFISELGATGSPHGVYVNYLGAIPAEIFILLFVAICFQVLPRTRLNTTGLVFVTIYAITLGIAAIFPCDFQCRPEQPTFAHNVHIATGLPAYLSGILAMFCISSDSVSWLKSKALKYFGFIAGTIALFMFLNLDPDNSFVGLYQRILELLIYSWLIYLGYCLANYLANKTSDM